MNSDDKKLHDLYGRFLEEREFILVAETAKYADFLEQGSYHAFSIPVTWLARGEVFGVADKVNEFWRHLGGLVAWNNIYKSIADDDKFNALVEFISPTADHCLGLPYSIKQMLIKSICHLSHQTNRFCDPNFSEDALKPDKQLKFHEIKKLAGRYVAWPQLRDALSQLDDARYRAESNDYRNRLNHGFAPGIEYGYLLTIQRVDDKPSSYNIMSVPPLELGSIIPSLIRQYKSVLQCYDRYIDLTKEQQHHWPKASHGSS
jgi:hypothetical protein